MIQLRDYQHEMIEGCRVAYRAGKRRVCLQGPTGCGKGTVLSFMAKSAAERGLRVGVVAHRGEILDQISRTLSSVEVPHGMIRAGHRIDRSKKVHVASVQTLVNRFDQVDPFDFIIGDEAHHCVSKTWVKVFAQYPNARWLGCTATPCRLDGKGLSEFFDHLVLGPSVSSLIEQGYLAKPRYFAPEFTPDFSHVRKVAGDFSKSEIEEVMSKPSITGCARDHYLRLANGKTFIGFCVNLKHCATTSEYFNAGGIRTMVIDGTMTSDERKRRLDALASGEITGLFSADLIGEGVDCPAVGAVILLRPTASLSLCIQQIGRGARPKRGDNTFTVLDHVGNVIRHGILEEPRDWSLDGNAAKRRPKEAVLETRQCPKCFAVFQGTVCPECGNERKSKAREIEEREGELREIAAQEMAQKRNARVEVATAKTYQELQAIGKARGYHHGWAWQRWKISKYNPANRRKEKVEIL